MTIAHTTTLKMKAEITTPCIEKWHLNNGLLGLPSRDQLSQWMCLICSHPKKTLQREMKKNTPCGPWKLTTLQMIEADGLHYITLSPPFKTHPPNVKLFQNTKLVMQTFQFLASTWILQNKCRQFLLSQFPWYWTHFRGASLSLFFSVPRRMLKLRSIYPSF